MVVSLCMMGQTLSKSIGGNDRAYTNGLPVQLIPDKNGLLLRRLTNQLDIYCTVVITGSAYERLSIARNECVNRFPGCGIF